MLPPWEPLFPSQPAILTGMSSLADGELYTGTVSSFQGNDPAISRSHSSRPTKTESSLNWLQGETLSRPPPPRPPQAL